MISFPGKCLWHKFGFNQAENTTYKWNESYYKQYELTDIGESAPRLLSRKNDAASIEATVSIMGLGWFEDELLIGGSADQTLPFMIKMNKIRHWCKTSENIGILEPQ